MKQLLSLLLLCVTLTATAQPVPTPTAPEQLQFADLQVRFDTDARRLVQQDINSLMANRQYWNNQLDRAVLYFPIIETVLLSNGIPADLKYLALQESALLPDAVSTSQAVGFWQFKLETAQDYGLTVSEEVDERKNISASTRATAKYLLRSNGIYNNWVSALFSFYLGTGGISRIVPPEWAKATVIDLNGSTDRYILRFFAHKLAVEQALKSFQPKNTFSLVEYMDGGGKTIDAIAGELNVAASDIRAYNRWLLVDHIPTDKVYTLVIPTPNNRINDVRQQIARSANVPITATATDDIGFPVLKRVTQYAGPAGEPMFYEINGLPGVQAQATDKPGTLARKARISLSSFLRYNDLGERDALVPGEVYYLAKKRKKALVPFHTARADESMRGISQRYGIRLKKLLRYNRMDRVQKLQVGRVLWLRERRPARKPIEVITSPTPPVYDNSPSVPSTRATTPTTEVQAGNAIPRNASERRRYQPKLVGEATPQPTEAATAPAGARSTASRPANVPMNRPAAPTPTVTTTAPPTPTASETEPEQPVATPRDAGSPQRTIIVRSEGEADRERTTPSRPGTYAETPDPTAPRTTSAKPKQSPTNQAALPKPLSRNDVGNVTPLPPMRRSDDAAAEPYKGRSAKHTVGAGQTFYSISKYYGISVADLMVANNLTLDDKLSVGQQLTVNNIPSGYPSGQPTSSGQAAATPVVPVAEAMPANVPDQLTYHTVAKGETLYRISKQYGVSVEELVKWNKLPGLTVKEGQKLTVSQ